MLGPLETFCQKDPDNPNFAQVLSVIRAVLGQKDAAIKEAERAITLRPSWKDAVAGPTYEENLAFVEVLVGDKNRAIPRLQRLLEIPYARPPYARASKAPSAMGPFAWRSRFPKTLRGKDSRECAEYLYGAEAAQCLQGRGRLCRRRLAFDPGRNAVFPFLEIPNWVIELLFCLTGARFSDRADHCLGIRADAGRNQANRSRGCRHDNVREAVSGSRLLPPRQCFR